MCEVFSFRGNGEDKEERWEGNRGEGEKKTQNKRTDAHCSFAAILLRNAVKEIFDEEQPVVKEQDTAVVSWEDLPEDGYFGMYTHFSIHETMLKVHSLEYIRIIQNGILIDPHHACKRILVVCLCVIVVCVPVTILDAILFICSQGTVQQASL